MKIFLNPGFKINIFPMGSLPKTHFPLNFSMQAQNGKKFRFVRISACNPLQYEVFDEVGELCAHVRHKGCNFNVKTASLWETILEIEDESLEQWQEEAFTFIATEVISIWYENEERVGEKESVNQ